MTKSRVARQKFVAGTSRGSRSAHTLLLQMAKEAEQLAEQAGRISDLRDAKGRQEGRRIPQPEVAEAVGVTLRAYQAWEGGASDLDPKNLKALADYFGVPAEFIEYGAGGRPRDTTPNPFASADAQGQLDRIEQRLTEIHELLLGDGRDEALLDGLAARLLRAAELPQSPADVPPATRRAARRRNGA